MSRRLLALLTRSATRPALPARIACLALAVCFLGSLLVAAEFDLVGLVSAGHPNRQEIELDELVALSGLFSAALGLLLALKALALRTERRKLREVERLAGIDALTSVANRRTFLDRLDSAFEKAKIGLPCAVLLIDLDGFKAINDRYGHAAGDRVLMHAARQIEALCPSGQIAARLGGDEFAMLVEGPAVSLENVRELVQSLEQAVAVPLFRAGDRLRVGASIGVAFAEPSVSSAAALLEAADAAMYRDKRRKRGTGSRMAA